MALQQVLTLCVGIVKHIAQHTYCYYEHRCCRLPEPQPAYCLDTATVDSVCRNVHSVVLLTDTYSGTQLGISIIGLLLVDIGRGECRLFPKLLHGLVLLFTVLVVCQPFIEMAGGRATKVAVGEEAHYAIYIFMYTVCLCHTYITHM